MKWSCKSLDDCLRSVPDGLQVALGLTFIAGVSAFKLELGHGIMLIDVLIIPVVCVGWFASTPRWGYVLAVVAAADSAVLAMYAETQSPLALAVASACVRLVVYVVILALLGMMRQERAGHQQAAATDRQTGAINARTFHELAEAEVRRSTRHRTHISLAYIDVDDFKSVNDRLGHAEGDRVLLEVSHVLRTDVRVSDAVGRVGGDEFAILMPETSAEAAATVIARVQEQLTRVKTSDGSPVECSIGLVTFAKPPTSVGELVSTADDLMYRAKRGGKNRVERSEHSTSAVPAHGVRSPRHPGLVQEAATTGPNDTPQ